VSSRQRAGKLRTARSGKSAAGQHLHRCSSSTMPAGGSAAWLSGLDAGIIPRPDDGRFVASALTQGADVDKAMATLKGHADSDASIGALKTMRIESRGCWRRSRLA